jgi:hypothetical protein
MKRPRVRLKPVIRGREIDKSPDSQVNQVLKPFVRNFWRERPRVFSGVEPSLFNSVILWFDECRGLVCSAGLWGRHLSVATLVFRWNP